MGCTIVPRSSLSSDCLPKVCGPPFNLRHINNCRDCVETDSVGARIFKLSLSRPFAIQPVELPGERRVGRTDLVHDPFRPVEVPLLRLQ